MKITELDRLEKRAESHRFTLGEVVARSGIARSTISRSRQKGEITVPTMRKLEDALEELIAEKQGDE